MMKKMLVSFALILHAKLKSLHMRRFERAFMETHLPFLKEKNPQLEVVTELIRGQHPHLKGHFKNHNQRVICVKNLSPEEILLHATRLRNALGRKVIKLRTRHVTKHPSVQGTWNTQLKF
ncbi:54S ribosomal protein L51, mitochondrial isoform X2 [Phalaenopsis equestris]|uniref:54S ribosomal protein L51, mitochondrial isoform X2 n=1 Tax=Phalaenopsis equestris TaxID=78828 RepID=UPI0009E27B44|nr:54S ribosomal protein L51, mitochondrial isoform X2 [Phalaenopsis equestris]